MEVRKNRDISSSQTIKVESLVGKKAVAKNGKELGKIKSIHLNPRELEITGFTLKSGMFSKEYYVGKEFVKSMNEDEVIMDIYPFQDFIGKNVLSATGAFIGTVKQVFKDPKNIKLVVEKKKGKDVQISENDINYIQEDIILYNKTNT